MKIVINVPARLARDIISGAHCGYWINNYAHRVRPDGSGLYIGRPVKGGEAAAGTPVPKARAFVGAAAVAEALRIMLNSEAPRIRVCAARVLGGDGDGPEKDMVLQIAVYGQLAWG
jgi:hypothetical protein